MTETFLISACGPRFKMTSISLMQSSRLHHPQVLESEKHFLTGLPQMVHKYAHKNAREQLLAPVLLSHTFVDIKNQLTAWKRSAVGAILLFQGMYADTDLFKKKKKKVIINRGVRVNWFTVTKQQYMLASCFTI